MKYFMLIALTLMVFGCQQKSDTPTGMNGSTSRESFSEQQPVISDELRLVQQNCYLCHNPNAKDHDNMLAPPLEAVKRRYIREYDTKEAFTSGMIDFLKDPYEEKAIMRGAVKRWGVMRLYYLSDSDLETIVKYIHDNELEKPEWFEAHHEAEHGKGKGHSKP